MKLLKYWSVHESSRFPDNEHAALRPKRKYGHFIAFGNSYLWTTYIKTLLWPILLLPYAAAGAEIRGGKTMVQHNAIVKYNSKRFAFVVCSFTKHA